MSSSFRSSKPTDGLFDFKNSFLNSSKTLSFGSSLSSLFLTIFTGSRAISGSILLAFAPNIIITRLHEEAIAHLVT